MQSPVGPLQQLPEVGKVSLSLTYREENKSHRKIIARGKLLSTSHVQFHFIPVMSGEVGAFITRPQMRLTETQSA